MRANEALGGPHDGQLKTTACTGIPHVWNTVTPPVIKHLQRGCVSVKRDADGNTYRRTVTSRAFKGDGTPVGVPAAWVISQSVEKAIAVLEQLQPADERYVFNVLRGSSAYRGPGGAASTSSTNWTLNLFVDWINDYCTAQNRPDRIPMVNGQRWMLSSRQFRRISSA